MRRSLSSLLLLLASGVCHAAHVELVSVNHATSAFGDTGSVGYLTDAVIGSNQSSWSVRSWAAVGGVSCFWNSVSASAKRLGSKYDAWDFTVKWIPSNPTDLPDFTSQGEPVAGNKLYKTLARHGAFINTLSNYNSCAYSIFMSSSAQPNTGLGGGTSGTLVSNATDEYDEQSSTPHMAITDISTDGAWSGTQGAFIATAIFSPAGSKGEIIGTFRLITSATSTAVLDSSLTLAENWEQVLFASGAYFGEYFWPCRVEAGAAAKYTVTAVGAAPVQ